MKIDFSQINADALARYPGLLFEWFPAGKLNGDEFRIGDIHGNAGDSLSVNIKSGRWADFAGDLSGGDPVSLYAAAKNIGQADAARDLAERMGHAPAPAPAPTQTAKRDKSDWTPIIPVPADAPTPPKSLRIKRGDTWTEIPVARSWTYPGYGLVCRLEFPDGSKDLIPVTFCTNADGSRRQWKQKSFPKPRPLYNLAEISARPDATVAVVEGEKTADAVRRLFPDLVAVTWPGGCKAVKHADWSTVSGRKVVICPDNDEPGYKAACTIADILRKQNCTVKFSEPPTGSPLGWDWADAPPKWDAAECWRVLSEKLADAIEWSYANCSDGADDEPLPPPPQEIPADYLADDKGPDDGIFSDAPFRVLGYARVGHSIRHYYLPDGYGQVISLEHSQHSISNLIQLATLQFWERMFPGKDGCDTKAALNALSFAAQKAGVYDPNRIRGRGAWWDSDGAVIHAGDRLIVDGKSYHLRERKSRFIYEAAAPMKIDVENPLTAREAIELRRLCELIAWDKPISAVLFPGMLVLMPICGAIKWRPHGWLNGGAGTGKSWILENIAAPVCGDWARVFQSETTEAGIRQKIDHDAISIIMDEAESENQKAQARMQGVLSLARQSSSSSSAPITKGSAGGEARDHKVAGIFLFGSIGVGIQQYADATRITSFGLLPPNMVPEAERAKRFKALQEKVKEIITPEFTARLRARTVRLIPVIRKNAETFAVASAAAIGTRRLGDQIGTLLAGAYSLSSDGEISAEKAAEWVSAQDWSEETAIIDNRDEYGCLAHILESRVTVKVQSGSYERTIAELIANICHRARPEESAGVIEASNSTLLRVGIRVEGSEFIVSNQHSGIAAILRNTQWAQNWGKRLKNINGAQTTEKLRFGPGNPSRGVAIPLREVFGDE